MAFRAGGHLAGPAQSVLTSKTGISVVRGHTLTDSWFANTLVRERFNIVLSSTSSTNRELFVVSAAGHGGLRETVVDGNEERVEAMELIRQTNMASLWISTYGYVRTGPETR